MSDESNDNLVDQDVNDETQDFNNEVNPKGENVDANGNVVSYDSHRKVLGQYKNAQKEKRELAERLAQLEAERENAEKSRLEERQEYKKLYENQVSQNQKILAEIAEKEKALVDDHKRRALEKELGGLKKSEYFKFADIDSIVINDDGTVDLNSVKFEANRYRQQYPELVTQSKQVILNNQAPSNDGILNKSKSPAEMSPQERSDFKRKQLLERMKQQ